MFSQHETALSFDGFLQEACPPLDLDWRRYRRRESRRRVRERLRELGLADYAAYLRYLREDPQEADALPNRMRVTVTRFFRERATWQTIADSILPRLAAEAPDGVLRALSVGCAGGEEPYSLTLVWLHWLQPRFPRHRLQVLATDIDEANLARAARGLYPPSSLREVPESIRETWFRPEPAGHLRLDPAAAALVSFRRCDLLSDPLPAGFDLVLCRYLAFTYFIGERRQAAAQRLRASLRPRGFLVIGRTENLDATTPGLEAWPQELGVYVASQPD